MGIEFSEEREKKFSELLTRYPVKRAALLPTLYLAQDQWGWLSNEVMVYVADKLDLTPAQVLNVATFYTMFKKKKTGKYHIQVCTNVSCALRGAYAILRQIKKAVKDTAADLFTVEEVECLASCGTAPMMQVNDDYYEELTSENVQQLLDLWLAAEQEPGTEESSAVPTAVPVTASSSAPAMKMDKVPALSKAAPLEKAAAPTKAAPLEKAAAPTRAAPLEAKPVPKSAPLEPGKTTQPEKAPGLAKAPDLEKAPAPPKSPALEKTPDLKEKPDLRKILEKKLSLGAKSEANAPVAAVPKLSPEASSTDKKTAGPDDKAASETAETADAKSQPVIPEGQVSE